MGCVSSSFLEQDNINGAVGVGHHIVSLTSTTYGLLKSLDTTNHLDQPHEIEVINSWELMAGLDPVSPKPPTYTLDQFPVLPPPRGERSLVLYTTTLGGIRKTFEECNAVRSALEGVGVAFKERDVSMDMGFREELRELLEHTNVPQLFAMGRYVGGAEAVLRIHEEGGLVGLLEGMPKARLRNGVCDGCWGIRFMPCYKCSGSRKVVAVCGGGGGGGGEGEEKKGRVVRCGQCNENGLVICPICS